MFKTDYAVGTLKTIAMVAGLAITFWSLGLPYVQFVGAANLTDVSDTLSDSTPSSASDHTIEFVSTSGVPAGETITVTFPPEFATGTVDHTDIDFIVNSADVPLAAAPSGATWGAVITGSDLVLTSGTGVINALETVEIRIGLHASGSDAQFTNPATPDSYDITIVSGVGVEDTGATIVVILDPVVVEASVNTSFTFTVDGVNEGVSINGDSTTATSTDTEVQFGVLTAGNVSMLGHEITVSTNASNGYVVTAQIDGPLESTGGDIIYGFDMGSDTNVPEPWDDVTENINFPNTWGHWGITSTDDDADRGDEFGSDEYIAASTSPRIIIGHNGPTNGTGNGVGNTFVGFKAVISELQAAGSDYRTNLIYVATPTF
jgi:hypothetical protein